MKTKSLIFALGICVMLLSGCVASVGTGYDSGYGYYPPAQPYYGGYYSRPYYAPRPVIVRPYRQPYRSNYNGYRGDGGRGNWNGNRGGGYHGGNSSGYHGGGHGRSH